MNWYFPPIHLPRRWAHDASEVAAEGLGPQTTRWIRAKIEIGDAQFAAGLRSSPRDEMLLVGSSEQALRPDGRP